ncbi:hypothetical protein M758_10G103400 [Ceratodon purpureus]|nr:hypothetical protein M758_10G103400 [Ceratodon purpureus]
MRVAICVIALIRFGSKILILDGVYDQHTCVRLFGFAPLCMPINDFSELYKGGRDPYKPFQRDPYKWETEVLISHSQTIFLLWNRVMELFSGC